jgi:hypothetical protein
MTPSQMDIRGAESLLPDNYITPLNHFALWYSLWLLEDQSCLAFFVRRQITQLGNVRSLFRNKTPATNTIIRLIDNAIFCSFRKLCPVVLKWLS